MMDTLKLNLKKQRDELSLKTDVKPLEKKSSSSVPNEDADNEKMIELVKDFLDNHKVPENNLLLPKFSSLVMKTHCDDEIQYRIRQECKRLVWCRMQSELLDQDDLMGLYGVLEKHATPPPQHEGHLDNDKYIVYADYNRAKEEADPRFRSLLTAKLFMRLITDDPLGRVQIVQIFNYVMKKIWLKQTRLGLLNYDASGKGYILEEGLDAYLKELLPTLSQLTTMDLTFEPFYICTASRKFFFFLDPVKKGKIKITDILSSGLIDDILDLREKERRESNWFCLESTLKVYGHYLALDTNHNGMLSREEFGSLSFGGGAVTLTDAFLDRLFMECLTFEREMDYRTYVDFVLAMENKKEVQSLQYFFRILDTNHKGYLNAFDLHYFYKDVERTLQRYTTEVPRFFDVKDEIFDMVKPEDPLKITLNDLIQCGKGDIVIKILIDATGFYEYDNRESIGVPDSIEIRSSEV